MLFGLQAIYAFCIGFCCIILPLEFMELFFHDLQLEDGTILVDGLHYWYVRILGVLWMFAVAPHLFYAAFDDTQSLQMNTKWSFFFTWSILATLHVWLIKFH